MPHSARDSDDDVEPKTATGRMQTRNLTVQSVNSPLRRSSRIKQTKCSPGSESDSSSINSTQTTRSSRTRTATMDSIVSDTKKLRTRKPSISSEISETMDVDVPRTPGKRTTRQSTGAATLGTPTRVNTRAASKRFVRAGSETKSPLPAARTTRRTRASSIDPESLSDQNKNQFDSPIKTRKRTSLLSSDSLVKEQIESEDRIPYVRLDATIVEIDEITNSEKVETSIDSLKSNETLQLEKETETQTEDVDRATVDVENKILDEGQYCLEKTLPTSDTIDEVSIHDSSSDHQSSSVKEDKVDIIEENLSNVEKSLINTCESTKELGIVSENLFDTSIEEEKSNKENQLLNIIRGVSTEKSSMQPNVTSYTKSLASPFMNKLSGEKESKSKKERSLSKRRCSRESTEKAIKHSDFSKETIDNSQEMMDISIESSDSIVINKMVLSQHDNIELVDKVIDKDETPIENISTFNENAEVISKSDKIDKIECIITDNKNPKKTELNEVDKTSCSSTTQVKLTRRSNSRESLISNLTTDDNEIKLVLEEQSPCLEVPSNVASNSKPDDSVDLQISLLVNESSDDRPTGIDKQSAITQDEVIDRTDSIEQEQKNLSKHITESASKSSNDVLETNNSACDDLNDTVIQNNQFPDVKAAEDCVMDISLEKTDAKDISLKKIVKQNLKRKSSDVLDLDAEKESSQMDMSQKDQEKMEIADDASDVNIGIDLFQNILADKWKEKNDVKTDSVQSTFQSMEDENEAECDLILVDKRAWLAAETIKAAKEIESFEYDSDDTVLLKSRSDAAQAHYDTKKLDPVSEEPLTEDEENEKQVKKQKPRTKRRLTSEIDQDSSRSTEDEDKSLNESKTALNRTNRFISKLNKSEQSTRTREPSKANDESNEEIEDDVSEFNRSPIISKRNTSLRKSMEGRSSLNKSKDIQNISANKLRIDNSEEEFDNTDAHAGQKLYKKKLSLNKSCNEDADDVIESEKKNVSIKDNSKKDKNTSLNRSVNQESKPIKNKITIHLSDDESDDNDINLKTMNLGSEAYFMIANAESDVDTDEYSIPKYIYATSSSSDDTDDNSCDSDINKEYNLDGVESKFSDDDDVAADECRASETEDSDSDDNGSDLADFIDDYDYVDDYERYDYEDEEKVEEEEDDDGGDDNDNDDDKDDDDQNMKEGDKNGNEHNVKEDEATEKEEMEDEEGKQAHIVRYTEPINMESEDEEDDKNVQEKDGITDKKENKFTEMETTLYASTSKLPKVHKSKDKSIEYISPHRSETEMKRHQNDIKMKKSNIKKNEKTTLLDSSNSDLSSQKKKKKSLAEENEINLLDTSNSISSSTKKKRKSDSQYFSGDGAERNSSKQLNESELMSTKRLSKSRLMEFSTPNLNTCKKLELDETFERISESEDIKLDNMIKTMKDTSVTKKKSKKDPILNKDINLKKFNYANKEKLSIRDLSPDLLELLHKTVSTSSKMELYKTMSICDSDTPTIKHLRKEKLNESAPVLSNTETHRINSLWKELFTENMQHTAQRKIKEKNKDQVSHLITSNDDTIQKHSQKKQKKHNKQQTSKEDITDETLSEDAIELKIPKKKKRAKLTQLAIVEDDARKDTCQIIEKKKKQETSKENVTDEVLSEDAIELKIPKKKKRAKLTQLAIAEDNARKDTCQIIEKKKKQETSKENITDEVLSEDAIELKIPKKKKRAKLTQLAIAEDNARKDTCQIIEKKKKQETSKENIIDEVLSEDAIEFKIPKKKKRAKLTQLAIVEDNIREDACQITEKKKNKKKRETSKESITDKDLSEDIMELKVPKKKKYAKLTQLAIVEDNAREDTCQIIEKKKKKKKQETSKENITGKDLSENVMELKVPKKKKRAKLTQLAIVEDNSCEDMYQITEKKKKKKQKILNENIELYSEEPLSDIDLKISEKETRAILRQFAIVKDNIYKNQVNEKEKKKKKQETLKENITKKTLSEDVELKISRKRKRGAKPSQLDIVEDNTTIREDTYQINEKEKKKKKKRTNELAEQDNINKYNVLRKNICKSKTELAQHKKKNKIVDDLELYSPADKQEKRIKKKINQEETIENIEILRTEKKKKKNTVPVQIPVSKLRFEGMSSPNILEQKTPLEMSELESTAYTTKILDEAIREAKRYLPKKLKPKKKRDRVEDIENVNVPTKKLKKHKEMNMFLPSSSGLKRLSDDVIENLTDVPTRAKKRKISRNEEQIVSKSSTTNKSKVRTANRDDAITLSTSGCTTQFQAVNLQNTKNQPSKEAASFKQFMLARNNRQPISAYMMYREKMRNAK